MKRTKILLLILVLHSLCAQAAKPVAKPDEIYVNRASVTLDITANDYDPDGDAIWIKEESISSPPCLSNVTVHADGTMDVLLSQLPCEFVYKVSSKSTNGTTEDSTGLTTVKLLNNSQINNRVGGIEWHDTAGFSYKDGDLINLGEVEENQEPITKRFSLKNSSRDTRNVTLQLIGDDRLTKSKLIENVALLPGEQLIYDIQLSPLYIGSVSGSMTLTVESSGSQLYASVSLEGVVFPTTPPSCNPSSFSVQNIPGPLEVEMFNSGGNNCSYYDSTDGNNANGEKFRVDESVDSRYVLDRTVISKTDTGEWLTYEVNIQEPGVYNVIAFYSYPSPIEGGEINSGSTIKMELLNTTVPPIQLSLPHNAQNGAGIGLRNFMSESARDIVINETGTYTFKLTVQEGGLFALDELRFLKIYEPNALPGGVDDDLTYPGDMDEVYIRQDLLKKNDIWDAAVGHPFAYDVPVINRVVKINGDSWRDNITVRIQEDYPNHIIVTGLQNVPQTNGRYFDIFKYKLKQGPFESPTWATVNVLMDPDYHPVVANDDFVAMPVSICQSEQGCPSITTSVLQNDHSQNDPDAQLIFSWVNETEPPYDDGLARLSTDPLGFCGHVNGAGVICYSPNPERVYAGGTDLIKYRSIESTFTCPPNEDCELPESNTADILIKFFDEPTANDDFTDEPLKVDFNQPVRIPFELLLLNDEAMYGGIRNLFRYSNDAVDCDDVGAPSDCENLIRRNEIVIDQNRKQIVIPSLSPNRPVRYFEYQVEDELRQKSEKARVNIQHGTNESPTGNLDTFTVYTGLYSTDAVVLNVLDNDVDSDSDLLEIVSISNHNFPGTAEISSDKQSILYTPPINYDGPTAFEYVVTDGELNGIARVNIHIVTSRPTANPDGPHIVSNIGATLILFDEIFLINDEGHELVVDHSNLDVSSLEGNIALKTNQSGNVIGIFYAPKGFTGETRLRYRVIDKFGSASDFADLNIEVPN